jgi:hypothetical protein
MQEQTLHATLTDSVARYQHIPRCHGHVTNTTTSRGHNVGCHSLQKSTPEAYSSVANSRHTKRKHAAVYNVAPDRRSEALAHARDKGLSKQGMGKVQLSGSAMAA